MWSPSGIFSLLLHWKQHAWVPAPHQRPQGILTPNTHMKVQYIQAVRHKEQGQDCVRRHQHMLLSTMQEMALCIICWMMSDPRASSFKGQCWHVCEVACAFVHVLTQRNALSAALPFGGRSSRTLLEIAAPPATGNMSTAKCAAGSSGCPT